MTRTTFDAVFTHHMRSNASGQVINAGRKRKGLSGDTIKPLAKLASGCARV